jgi:hypothetical protein
MEFGQTVNRPSPILAQVTFCVHTVLTLVLAKHSKSLSLIDCISVGVDRMQGNFEPMRKQVETWQKSDLTDVTAKVDLPKILQDLNRIPKREEQVHRDFRKTMRMKSTR